MFIRFVSGEVHEDSHVLTGLFFAVFELKSSGLPDYELEALIELRDWFNVNLDSPFDHLRSSDRFDRAICWFRHTARDHLRKAWELATVLERNDVLIWTIRSKRTGYVYYEDEVQVFAEPFNDVRLVCRR
jgi:hypothetical protein